MASRAACCGHKKTSVKEALVLLTMRVAGLAMINTPRLLCDLSGRDPADTDNPDCAGCGGGMTFRRIRSKGDPPVRLRLNLELRLAQNESLVTRFLVVVSAVLNCIGQIARGAAHGCLAFKFNQHDHAAFARG